MNSAYSFVLGNYFFPTGEYKVYILHEIEKVLTLDPETNTLVGKDGEVPCGLIKAILLTGLESCPYFYHNVAGTSEKPRKIACICRTCAKYGLNRPCRHVEKNR